MSLKVGIVTEYSYPLLGGISENVYHTAAELKARGHRATIITAELPGNGATPLAHPNGIPTRRIGRSVAFTGNGAEAHFAVGPHLWRDIRATLDAERFDIVQLHSPLFFTLPALATLRSRCPRVGTFHSVFEHKAIYSMLAPILQSQFLARMQGITVVSPSVQRAMSRYFQMDARVIPNGIDMRQFHPDVARLEQYDREKKTLLFLGRFDPRNGLPFMIRTFERIRQRVPDVRLLVVGQGSLDAVYRAMVPDALREDIHFCGPALLDRPSYYATADVFCSPVSHASFGITLLESMASGTPVVAADNTGYRELLGPGEAVISPLEEQAFADATIRVLEDDRLRTDLRAAGLRKASEYAWPVVVDSLLAYFDEILSKA